MNNQIPSHEIPRSIEWLAVRLEARINEEIPKFIKQLNNLAQDMNDPFVPKWITQSEYRKLIKLAKKLEPVLYIIEFQNKDAAETIKALLGDK